MFTYRNNNRLQKKSVGQNTNILIYPPPQLSRLATALDFYVNPFSINMINNLIDPVAHLMWPLWRTFSVYSTKLTQSVFAFAMLS